MHTPSKATPANGSIQAEGVNIYNTGAIVDATPTLANTNADEYVRAGANEYKAKLLAKAMVLTTTYAPKTLWTRRMTCDNTTYDVCIEQPGVLCVYDPKTGDELTTGALVYPMTQK